MKLKNRNFPHPVLSESTDDYIDGYFKVSKVIPINDINNFRFKLEVDLEDESLENLLKERKAEIVLHLECPKTSFRKAYKTFYRDLEVKVEEAYLNSRVEVSCFIIARENLKSYSSENFHSDYEDISFDISRGQFLAIANDYTINITKNTDNLQKMSSIIKFSSMPASDKEINYDLGGDIIYIRLSDEQFNLINNINLLDNTTRVLHTILIYPALIYVFEELKRDSETNFEMHSDKRWFSSLKLQLEQQNIELDRDLFEKGDFEPYKIAQKLLDNPTYDSLKDIYNMDKGDF